MPFITKERRDVLESPHAAMFKLEPGDLCYIHYRSMIDQWKENPRWTTAHEIFRDYVLKGFMGDDDEAAARSLAWQIFFQLHVMPYEMEKRQQHGDIE